MTILLTVLYYPSQEITLMHKKNTAAMIRGISSYVAWEDFRLVCRKTLHSNSMDTPPEHEHKDFYELVVVASGSGLHRLQDREWRIAAGNVFLIPPHRQHCYVEYDNLLIYNLLFSQKFIRYFLPDLNRLPGYQLLFNFVASEAVRCPGDGICIQEEYFPKLLHLLEEMDKLNSSLQPGDKTLLLSNFGLVMLLLSKYVHWSGPQRQLANIEQLTRLLEELGNNIATPWSLEQMARFCNMSVSGFRQSFRRLTGVPPLEYLVRLRLSHALNKLEFTRESLTDIALSCGFNDVNYFSRQFKKHYSFLPARYRKECQAGVRLPGILQDM